MKKVLHKISEIISVEFLAQIKSEKLYVYCIFGNVLYHFKSFVFIGTFKKSMVSSTYFSYF